MKRGGFREGNREANEWEGVERELGTLGDLHGSLMLLHDGYVFRTLWMILVGSK
jgi:hypothetical protein